MEFVYLMLNLLTVGLKVKQLIKVPLEWFMVIVQQILLIWLLFQPVKFLMAMSKNKQRTSRKIMSKFMTAPSNKIKKYIVTKKHCKPATFKKRFSLGSSKKKLFPRGCFSNFLKLMNHSKPFKELVKMHTRSREYGL